LRTIIRTTIDSLKTKETEQFKNHPAKLHTLLKLILERRKKLLLDKLTVIEANFRHQTMKKSIQKLQWPKQKDSQTDCDKPQTDKEFEEKKHKHVRFIKRNRWRKIQQRQSKKK
jgi:hypothetical protein